jgi:CDP-diacylglycerol--serine O-phosphatidyltransferase
MELEFRLRKRRRWLPVLPTLLTLGNAICGFGAITFAAKVGPQTTGDPLFVAALLVYLGMVFDMLDGHTARLTKQTSNFGAELDSMCDVITFGVAPAFIMLKFCEANQLSVLAPLLYHRRIVWVVAALYTTCAVLRLARFNVETDEGDSHESFNGLPSPAAAGMIASIAVAPGLTQLVDPRFADSADDPGYWIFKVAQLTLPALTLIVSCLMVSRVRYPHLTNQLFRGRRTFQHVRQLIFALVAIFAFHELAIPLVFGYFVLASPLRALWDWLMRQRPNPAPAAPAAQSPQPPEIEERRHA